MDNARRSGVRYRDGRRNDASQKRPDLKSRIVITEFDGVILASILVLLLIGIIMVFSSSYYTAMREGNGMFHYVIKQLQAAGMGMVALFIMANVDYHLLGIFTPIMYIGANILLPITMQFGIESHGARRWLAIPVFGQVQTTEIVKAAVILFLAFFISSHKDLLKRWTGFIACCVIVIIPAGLSYLCTSSLSSAITIAALGFGMIFVASPYFWRFVGMLGSAVIALTGWLLLGDSYQSKRMEAFLDPFSDPIQYGYQTIQSLYAVASGGLFGLGLGSSRQKLFYMPEPHNDFIFAIICEELGFAGAAVVILLFSLLIYRGVRVALNAPDLLGTLIATGIVVMIAVQVIINVGVVTNTIPNTGIPMPFISYGGSSILFLMAQMGILLNISRYSRINS